MGSDVLEVGPGPGVSTDLLRGRVRHPTCVEADRAFSDKLRRRLDQSVRVMCEDATAMSLADQSFDGNERTKRGRSQEGDLEDQDGRSCPLH